MPAKDTAASSTPLSGADLWSSSLASHVPFLIARARALMVRRCNQALRPLGLNVRTFSLLWLTTEPVPATQRELSDFLDLDPSQVVALIDDLEAQGLVERRANPADRRARQTVATEKGRRLCGTAQAAVDRATEEVFAGLTEGEQAQLTSLLLGINRQKPSST